MKKKTKTKRPHAKAGEGNPNCKLTVKIVRGLRLYFSKVRPHGSKAEAAEKAGISRGALSDILSGRRWAAIGKG